MGDGKTVEWWDDWTARMQARHANGNGHGPSLAIETLRLLPTPTAMDCKASVGQVGSTNVTLTDATVRQADRFGKYGPAIARWEHLLGRAAPPPTEPTGRNAGARLNPRFTEWMMGLSDGWVVDTPGVTREDALRALGNGVVPQQGAAALRILLAAEHAT
jgi:DNA (cytosine-5)-methyltransferase 1